MKEETDDNFFSQQRGKSQTVAAPRNPQLRVPAVGDQTQLTGEKLGPKKYNRGNTGSQDGRGRKRALSDAQSAFTALADKQKEIEDEFAQLKHLPKQKLHPFDLRPEELMSIKTQFPEFKKRDDPSKKRITEQLKRMPLTLLKELMKEKIKIPSKAMDNLIGKLDHKHVTEISWTEFLNFLDLEGIRRETVNDAQLYGFGVKRLEEKERVSMKMTDDQQAEYYLNHMVHIEKGSFRLIVTLFDNNEAKVYDARNWKMIQELKFPSDYAVAKPLKEKTDDKKQFQSQNELGDGASETVVTMADMMSRQHSGIQGTTKATAVNDYLDAGLETIQEKGKRKRRANSKITTSGYSQHRSRTSMEQAQFRSHATGSPPGSSWQHKRGTSTTVLQKPGSATVKQNVRRASIMSQNFMSTGAKDLQLQKNDSVSTKVDIQKNARNYMSHQSIPRKKEKAPDKQLPSIMSTSNYSNTQKSERKGTTTRSKTSSIGRSSAPTSLLLKKNLMSTSVNKETEQKKQTEADPYLTAWRQDPYNLNVAQKTAARQQVLDQKARTKIYVHLIGDIPVNHVMGLTGYDNLNQNESAREVIMQAATQGIEPDADVPIHRRAFRLQDVKPNFKLEKKKNEKAFMNQIAKIESQIKEKDMDREFDKHYKEFLEKKEERDNQDLPVPFIQQNELDVFMETFYKVKYHSSAVSNQVQQKHRDHIKKLFDDRRVMEKKFSQSAAKLKEGKKWLAGVKETNRYFYRLNPKLDGKTANPDDMIGKKPKVDETEAERERRREQEDAQLDSEMFMEQTPNVCTHEMIVNYVENLQQQAKKKPVPYEYLDIKHEQNNAVISKDSLFEANRKNRIKHTKAVTVTAADYNQELGLLAICLIDREVKIYYIKQNGTKIALLEQFSFKVKFTSSKFEPQTASWKTATTCPISSVQIDRYATNNRPIVILSSMCGDVSIYYIDDVNEKGQLRQKLLKAFNFIDRGPEPARDSVQGGSQLDSENEDANSTVRVTFTNSERPDMHFLRTGQLDEQEEHGQETVEEEIEDPMNRKQGGLLVDSLKQIQDGYWDILVNTKGKETGLDGITIWNQVSQKIKEPDVASKLVKELLHMKFDDTPVVEEMNYLKETTSAKTYPKLQAAIDKWQLCLRICGGALEDTTQAFRAEMAKLKKQEHTSDGPYRSHDKNKVISSLRAASRGRAKSSAGGAPSGSSYAVKSKKERAPTATKQTKSSVTGDKSEEMKEITKIRYIRDIGLIGTTFRGIIKIFDAFNFYQIWKNDNKMRTAQQHTNIKCFDVSGPLGIMATGGAEGRIVLIDPYALGVINGVEGHKATEILHIFIYNDQQQIITIAKDKTISLWDAFRLDKIQTIRDTFNTHVKKFSSAQFDSMRGLLYIGDQEISVWQAQIDSKVEIQALQVQTLSENMLKERNLTQLMALGGSRQGAKLTTDAKTGKVLISRMSTLVEIIVNSQSLNSNLIITVDSENLLRGWSLLTQSTSFSYKIPFEKRVTAAAVDMMCKHLAVGNCDGEVQILNFKSGGVLYTLPHQNHEITCLEFLTGSSEFWLAAGCWRGKIVLWTEPTEANNFSVSAKCRIGHREDSDILVIDHAKAYFVTGGVDGLLSIWNQFSGVLKYAVTLPAPHIQNHPEQKFGRSFASLQKQASDQERKRTVKAQQQLRSTIVGLLIHPYYTNLVFVMQEGGSVHIVDVTNGMVAHDFVAHMKVNSNWAIDKSECRIMVVGETGKAALFDCVLGNQPHPLPKGFRQTKAPQYVPKESVRLQQLRPWFYAHEISRGDHSYVNAVKFANQVGIFVSGTSSGEVKLWSKELHPLGTLNSTSWDIQKIERYIQDPKQQRGQ